MEREVHTLPPPLGPGRVLPPANQLSKEIFFASVCSSCVGGSPAEADFSRNVERFRAPRCGFVEIDLPTPQGVCEVGRLNGPIDAMEEETRLVKSTSWISIDVSARCPGAWCSLVATP